MTVSIVSRIAKSAPDDYLTVPVEKVVDLHSVLTMVGGKVVYGERPFAALEGR